MKKKEPEAPKSVILFVADYYKLTALEVEGNENSSDDDVEMLDMHSVAIRMTLDGEIQDVEAQDYQTDIGSFLQMKKLKGELKNPALVGPGKEDIINKLNQRSFDVIPRRLYLETEVFENFCIGLVHFFRIGEMERIERIEQLEPNEIESAKEAAKQLDPPVATVTVLNKDDFLKKLEPKIKYFADHVGSRIYWAIAQLALEAQALNLNQKLPKSYVRNIEEVVQVFRQDAIEVNLIDGRGSKVGTELFDRKAFKLALDQKIVDMYNRTGTSREITQKAIAHDLGLGDITKGSGADVLRKRMRLCGMNQSWSIYVDSVVQERKRKTGNQKSKK